MPGTEPDVVGRITRAADFERVLATPATARSEHFAVHHLSTSPTRPRHAVLGAGLATLSTARQRSDPVGVDDLPGLGPACPVWLGTVVPKRLARRAVTRNLIKRHMRACVQTHRDRLQGGLWVVRMKSPFDRSSFASAASSALGCATRAELETIFGRLTGVSP